MSLSELRKGIDKLDYQLISVLSKRAKISKKIARYKQKNNVQIMQNKRMKDMFKKRRELAEKLGVDPEFVEHIFLDVINESIKIQKKTINK
jgi:chorismate mutase